MCSRAGDAERAQERQGTGQEHLQPQSATGIALNQMQQAKESNEMQEELGRAQTVAEKKKASRVSHSEGMQQVRFAKSEQEREMGTDSHLWSPCDKV